MAHKFFILVITISFASSSIDAQCTFEKFYEYHPVIPDAKTYTISTSDGGFLTVMSCYYDPLDSFGNDIDMAIVKTDACGNTLWKMHYGNPLGNDFASGCIETSDGNYLVAGSTENGPALSNFRVVKFSKDGNMIWDSVYNGVHESVCFGITKRTNKNSAFIYGYEDWPTMQTPTLIEIDENGHTLRSLRLFNHPKNYPNYFAKLLQLNDSAYDLIGVSSDTLYLVQTDTSFNIKINTPILYKSVLFYDACLTNDHNTIILAGSNVDTSFYNDHIYMYSISGNLKKKIRFPNDTLGYPWFISPTHDNGFLLGNGLLKGDSNFNFLNINWWNTPRGVIYDAFELPDGSIIASGATPLHDSAYGEMYIIKTDRNGKYAYSGIDKAQLKNTDISIYPNPATNELHIVQSGTSNKQLAVSLFDITGKQIISTILFTNTTSINTSSLNEGIYFVRIINVDGAIIKVQKIAVVR